VAQGVWPAQGVGLGPSFPKPYGSLTARVLPELQHLLTPLAAITRRVNFREACTVVNDPKKIVSDKIVNYVSGKLATGEICNIYNNIYPIWWQYGLFLA
jgi:hypothetical protein